MGPELHLLLAGLAHVAHYLNILCCMQDILTPALLTNAGIEAALSIAMTNMSVRT